MVRRRMRKKKRWMYCSALRHKISRRECGGLMMIVFGVLVGWLDSRVPGRRFSSFADTFLVSLSQRGVWASPSGSASFGRFSSLQTLFLFISVSLSEASGV